VIETDTITVPIKRINPDVELPGYAYEGDAGLDLRSAEDVSLKPFERRLISTGLAIAIPEGYAGFVQPRSGLALKQGLSMANTPGLIDAHYRGELKICAINLDPTHTIEVKRGDRIAQLVIQKVPVVKLVEVAELDETDRGAGGFGSSGVSQ
jgi:dUTP pyrophosphatase